MRTVHFETLLKAVWGLFTGVSEVPGTEEYPLCRELMDLSLGEVWEREEWTDLCRNEERTPDANGLIAYLQTDETPIGEIFECNTANPEVTEDYEKVIHRVTHEGAQIVGFNAGDVVWLNFRLQRPLLTGDLFDAETIYAAGAQVYFSAAGLPGNLYNCVTTTAAGESPVSAAAKWELVEIPYIFKGYLVWSTFGKLLESDGQDDKAAGKYRLAEKYLAQEGDKQFRQSAGQKPLELRTA